MSRERTEYGASVRDGVNPFQRPITSVRQHELIVAGREAMHAQLESLAECDVTVRPPVKRGSAVMDEFSFRRKDAANIDRLILFERLRKLVDFVQEDDGVVLVYVDHRRYDWRAPGLDLTTSQCLVVVAVLFASASLAAWTCQLTLPGWLWSAP